MPQTKTLGKNDGRTTVLTYPHFKPHFDKSDWTLGRVLEHQARVRPDRPFLQWTDSGPKLSFAEVNRKVNSVAHGLQQLGIRKDDRIVLFMPNCLELIFAWFGANKIGAVQAPINTAYKGSILEHQVNICGAETIIVANEFLPQLEESLGGMKRIKRVIVWSPEGSKPGALPNLAGRTVIAFNDLFSGNEENPGVEVYPQDLAAILFTSGTTGPSKGVLMPHAQFYFFSEQDVQMVGLRPDDVYLTAFPFFHGNAQFLTLYPCLIVGALCVMYERFSATQWLERIRASGATVTNGLGATLSFIHAQPATPHDKDHKLRMIYSAPTPHELLPAFKEHYGDIGFTEGFGQTEICLPFVVPPGMTPPKGACGVLVDQWLDVRLVNPATDEEVPPGEIGELLVRPKQPWLINQGYSNMPEKTIEAFRNLWFHTGDGLRRDNEGWYYFVDRMKDALRRRGENISSFEVEEPIRRHPAVADVAIVAMPAEGEASEDEVKAFIVLKAGHDLRPEQIIEWCEPLLPYFVIPRFIDFLPDLPRTQSEKIQKAELRKMGNTAKTWDRVRSGYILKDEAKRQAKKTTT
jgi:crotonobetaine/carnitine-CoA ligase